MGVSGVGSCMAAWFPGLPVSKLRPRGATQRQHRPEPKSNHKVWLAALAGESIRRAPSAAVDAIRRLQARHGRSAPYQCIHPWIPRQ
eukprot:5115664-Prymnesium_polylepis.1